jgi:Flp pilus assembly protein TadG
MVEAAIVLPVAFMLILGMIVIGLGVFRYQQVASLAREGARWASVHGGSYASETGNAAANAAAVYSNAIQPNAAGLDTSLITYSVTWDDPSKNPIYLSNAATNTYRVNYVTVTVHFAWTPEAYIGATTLSSTSRMQVTY